MLLNVNGRLDPGSHLRSRSSRGEGSSGPCEMSVVVLPDLAAVPIATEVFEGAIPVQVRCGLAILDEMWVAPADVVDVDAEARGAAERYVRSVLAPRLSMGTSPPANVLVGLSTWFWLDGWDGSPLRTSVVAPWGESISIEMTLAGVDWDFGDGASHRGDLGDPYPAESSVQHVYTHRSTSPSAPDGAYDVTASVQINVRYWYDGGGPYAVSPLVEDHTAPVIVRQLQAVLR